MRQPLCIAIYRFAQPFWEIFPLAAGGETPPLRPYKFQFNVQLIKTDNLYSNLCTKKRYRAAQGKNDYSNLAHDLAARPAGKFQYRLSALVSTLTYWNLAHWREAQSLPPGGSCRAQRD